MAGGLAKQGAVPVVAVYSTFLQRAYDMILQDICLLKLHVILAVDRAGLVGEDGETHHGVFDVGFLRQAPGMTVLCPGSQAELQDMLQWAAEEQDGPVAIRYPRGGDREDTLSRWENSLDVKTRGAVVSHAEGKDAVIITYGTLVQNAMEAARLLSERGIRVSVLRLQTISPLPVEKILEMTKDTTLAVVLEETGEESCVCKDLAYALHNHRPDLRIHGINLGRGFAPHGSVSQLYRQYGLDGESVASWIEEVHHHEK
jgi:1-deoxy-D-xylulose-5-phosphate synthase